MYVEGVTRKARTPSDLPGSYIMTLADMLSGCQDGTACAHALRGTRNQTWDPRLSPRRLAATFTMMSVQ